jgi:hypothetical protein
MKDNPPEFAIRKERRDLQPLRRLLGSLFKLALLVTALGLYWRWSHGYPGIGPIFLSERKLVTANATYFVPAFGLSGGAVLIAAGLLVPAVRRLDNAHSPEHKQGSGCSDSDSRTSDIAIAFDVTDPDSRSNSLR